MATHSGQGVRNHGVSVAEPVEDVGRLIGVPVADLGEKQRPIHGHPVCAQLLKCTHARDRLTLRALVIRLHSTHLPMVAYFLPFISGGGGPRVNANYNNRPTFFVATLTHPWIVALSIMLRGLSP